MPINELNYEQVCALVEHQLRGEFTHKKLSSITAREKADDGEESGEVGEQNVGQRSAFRPEFDRPQLVEFFGRLFRLNSLGTRLKIDLNVYVKLDNEDHPFGFVKDPIVLFGAFVFGENGRSKEEIDEERKCEHFLLFQILSWKVVAAQIGHFCVLVFSRWCIHGGIFSRFLFS